MQLDHRRIVATALGRLRGKLKYRPVVFELLPPTFTLLQLQRLVEALSGVRLHKQNFRRLVEGGGLVEGTGRSRRSGGRPAELFRFRREVAARAARARRRHALGPQLSSPRAGRGHGVTGRGAAATGRRSPGGREATKGLPPGNLACLYSHGVQLMLDRALRARPLAKEAPRCAT